jgi:hypothetical protein
MSNQTIKFKENPAAGNLGLELEGRSKFPGCVDIIQPAIGMDGRWKTGLDEHALSIVMMTDSEARTAKQAEIIAERESLERVLNADLSATSKYWESFFVEVNPNVPLNLANPLDRVRYHVISVCDGVAPNLKAAGMMEYRDAKYYISREFEEVGDRLESKKRYNLAATEFVKLMESPDRAVLVGRYLDLPVSNNTPPDNIYEIFQNALDADKATGFVNRFLAAVSKSPEELNIKLIFSDATKYNVIRYNQGLYQRGQITLGKSPEEAVRWLTDVTNSGELLSIQEEIDIKRKFG